METISERIVEGMAIRKMKQVDIIEKTGINKGALSSYISGKYEPKQTNIYKIAKALDVNEAWLMGHDVPMERKPEGVVGLFTGSNKLMYGSFKEETLIQKYRLLDDKGKHTVDTILEMEYIRCNKPHLLPNAAHERPGATIEDKMHDDALMNDENF